MTDADIYHKEIAVELNQDLRYLCGQILLKSIEICSCSRSARESQDPNEVSRLRGVIRRFEQEAASHEAERLDFIDQARLKLGNAHPIALGLNPYRKTPYAVTFEQLKARKSTDMHEGTPDTEAQNPTQEEIDGISSHPVFGTHVAIWREFDAQQSSAASPST
ncbi:hypothetical protein HK105_203530 [Polyrhizophydium stewartii]|uniref:Uncharacterized protein n=1 Tax=Polyrhizophydium stewartii TaxID=2732419 RepID=A0ABR4NB49_9FUNG